MAFNIDVEVNDMTVEEINNLVNKIMTSPVEEKLEVSEKELQEQAKIFLSAIQKLEIDKALFEESALKFVAFKGDPKSVDYEQEKINAYEKAIMQQEYLLANNFEKYLSAYRKEMERSAIYVTVDKDGKISGSYEIPMKEMITYTDKTGSFLAGQINSLSRQSLEEQGLFDEKHVEEAKNAYWGVYNRLERYYEVHNKKGDKKLSGILLWKEKNEWQAGRVLNYGDLKEAYIGFLFSDHGSKLCTMSSGNPPYYNHNFIGGFFKKYINEVTNLAAIVEEDIKSKRFNKQYAVKGAGAHLPSLDQYIKIANSIVHIDKAKYITRKKIEERIKEQNPANAKRNIKIAIEELAKEELETLIKEFNNKKK